MNQWIQENLEGGKVAKHGNRSVTSQCGSADVVEALGVKLTLPPARVAQCLQQVGLAERRDAMFAGERTHRRGRAAQLREHPGLRLPEAARRGDGAEGADAGKRRERCGEGDGGGGDGRAACVDHGAGDAAGRLRVETAHRGIAVNGIKFVGLDVAEEAFARGLVGVVRRGEQPVALDLALEL